MSVRLCFEIQPKSDSTVMLPEPAYASAPVCTVTSVVARVFCSVVTLRFEVAPDGPERAMLLRVAATVAAQGYDWRAYFTDASAVPNFNTSVPFAPGWTLTEHGVNHAMALKEGAVAWRAGGGALAAELSRLKVALLDKLHGMPTGAFSADECLGGREPNRGVELCTIVETAYSLALMHRTHGDIALADRAERVIYNGLPGALSDDMWSHNYLSQSNEIFAGHGEPHTWRTDGPDSTAYGLAPTYGCCTANFIQVRVLLARVATCTCCNDAAISSRRAGPSGWRGCWVIGSARTERAPRSSCPSTGPRRPRSRPRWAAARR